MMWRDAVRSCALRESGSPPAALLFVSIRGLSNLRISRPSAVEVFSSRPFVSIRGLVSQFAVAFGSLLLSLRYGNIDY